MLQLEKLARRLHLHGGVEGLENKIYGLQVFRSGNDDQLARSLIRVDLCGTA